MSKIIDYKIHSQPNAQLLESIVLKSMDYDWQPLGAAQISNKGWYSQTMVKYESTVQSSDMVLLFEGDVDDNDDD